VFTRFFCTTVMFLVGADGNPPVIFVEKAGFRVDLPFLTVRKQVFVPTDIKSVIL